MSHLMKQLKEQQTEEVVEDNTFEETVKKIKALNLDLSDKSIKDSTIKPLKKQ